MSYSTGIPLSEARMAEGMPKLGVGLSNSNRIKHYGECYLCEFDPTPEEQVLGITCKTKGCQASPEPLTNRTKYKKIVGNELKAEKRRSFGTL